MISCFKCKKEISEEARTCPKCGQPQFYATNFIDVVIMLIASFIFFGEILHFLGFEPQKIDVYAGLSALVLTVFAYKKRKMQM